MRALFAAAVTAACLLTSTGASSAAAPVAAEPQPAVLAVVVNEVPKGDVMVLVTTDEHWLIEESALQSLGLSTSGPQTLVDGKPYFRLDQLGGLTVSVDNSSLTATITAKASLFAAQRISLSSSRLVKTDAASGVNGFLNYELTGYTHPGTGPSLALEGALRVAEWSLFSTAYRQVGDGAYGVQTTRVSRDWPDKMMRLELGDVAPASAAGGTGMPLRGISLSRSFETQPYFQRSPSTGFSGSLDVPGVAEVYVDGALVRTVPLKPGAWELDALRYGPGLHATEVVVRDRGGNVLQRSGGPVYFPASGLAPGVSDYALAVGALAGGEQRGRGAYVARYAAGINNQLTVGGFVQGEGAYTYTGAASTLTLGKLGTITGQLTQASGGVSGQSALLGYSRQAAHMSFSVGMELTGEHFRPPAAPQGYTPSRVTSGTVVYSATGGRSLSLALQRQEFWNAATSTNVQLGYSHRAGPVTVLARLSQATSALPARTEASLSLNWDLGGATYARAYTSRVDGTSYSGADVSQLRSRGEGWSYRAAAQRDGTAAPQTTAFAQYDSSWSRVATNVTSGAGSPDGTLTFASSLVLVDGTVKPSRRVYESFALVDAGLPGVGVNLNNQAVGRTDARGQLLVPTLTDHSENQISLNEQDIPIEYSVDTLRKIVIPPRRAGVRVRFPVTRIQAAEGSLVLVDDAGVKHPLASKLRISAKGLGERLVAPQADGRFYLEDLPAGTWTGSVSGPKMSCAVTLVAPPRSTPLHDLGEVRCAIN